MNVCLRPELAKFIDEQVKTGRFNSPEDAVNAAVAKSRLEEGLLAQDISDDDFAAIEKGLAQLNRGEGIPLADVRAEMAAKYLIQ
jgi:Arc/MetJ-type ribon-helix-helix transcriptional regulator